MSAADGMIAGSQHTGRLSSLELGRGIAALAVVAHHAGQASSAFTTQSHRGWFADGALGVDFFFVLSGFIIYHVHSRDARTANMARRYFGKRLRRIYVPYLPITLALIAAYALLPGISEGNRDWSIFTSLTLLPSGGPPALSVAWTLVFEMTFYIVFLTFYLTCHFWMLVWLWVFATIGINSSGGGHLCNALQPAHPRVRRGNVHGRTGAQTAARSLAAFYPLGRLIVFRLFRDRRLTSCFLRVGARPDCARFGADGNEVRIPGAETNYAARCGLLCNLPRPQPAPITRCAKLAKFRFLVADLLRLRSSGSSRRNSLPPALRNAGPKPPFPQIATIEGPSNIMALIL